MVKLNSRFAFLILLVTGIAIVIGCWDIGHPGLYYDEMLFGNAAVGGKTNEFVQWRVHGIPVLLMDYIGALKAWIYYPIFSVFPVNAWSVRLPSLLIGILGGLALVLSLWRGFGPAAAVAGAVLILLDPTLITHSRLDWGPNALMFFFRGWMVFCTVEWIRTGKPLWAWLAWIILCLGLFDKLNFIWVACAGIGALVVVYPAALRTFARTYPRQAAGLAVLILAVLGMTIFRCISVAEHKDIGWGPRIAFAWGQLRVVFTGGGALKFISGDGLRLEKWLLPVYGLAAVVSLTGWKTLGRIPSARRLYAWIWVFFLLLVAAFILTKSAEGPHHAAVVSGIWQLVLAPLLGASWEARTRMVRGLLVPAALALVAAGCVVANGICIRAFAEPLNLNWDRANARAALFGRAHPGVWFLSVDWGIGAQFETLTRGNPDIHDAWSSFERRENAVTWIRDSVRTGENYVYTRLPGFENFKGNRDNFLAALDSNHLRYIPLMRYPDWKGEDMIEIGKIEK